MIVTSHDVFCDHPSGCGMWCGSGWKTKREARSRAKRLGWGRKLTDRGVVDLCPKHAKEEGL